MLWNRGPWCMNVWIFVIFFSGWAKIVMGVPSSFTGSSAGGCFLQWTLIITKLLGTSEITLLYQKKNYIRLTKSITYKEKFELDQKNYFFYNKFVGSVFFRMRGHCILFIPETTSPPRKRYPIRLALSAHHFTFTLILTGWNNKKRGFISTHISRKANNTWDGLKFYFTFVFFPNL